MRFAAGFFAAAVVVAADFVAALFVPGGFIEAPAVPAALVALLALVVARFGVAAGLAVRLGAVADFGPRGLPGFAAPTVDGEPLVARERIAVDGVVFAAGVPGVEGGAVGLSSPRRRSAASTPRLTADLPRSTAVSMSCFGLMAMAAILPVPTAVYTGCSTMSPQASATASDARRRASTVPSGSRSSPQARARSGAESKPSSSDSTIPA